MDLKGGFPCFRDPLRIRLSVRVRFQDTDAKSRIEFPEQTFQEGRLPGSRRAHEIDEIDAGSSKQSPYCLSALLVISKRVAFYFQDLEKGIFLQRVFVMMTSSLSYGFYNSLYN